MSIVLLLFLPDINDSRAYFIGARVCTILYVHANVYSV